VTKGRGSESGSECAAIAMKEDMERVDIDDHPLSSSYTSGSTGISSNNLSSSVGGAGTSGSRNYYYLSGTPSPVSQPQFHPRSASSSHATRSPAASLIQSAARSVLDDTTPNTAVSDDDGSEDCSCADGVFGRNHPLRNGNEKSTNNGHYSTHSSPAALSSLQMKTLPAIPDEQDRKRFVVSCYLLPCLWHGDFKFHA
jgi:hypothetical protein